MTPGLPPGAGVSARGHCSAPTDESECIGHGHPQDDSTWPESHNFISAGLSGGMAELAPRLHSAIATLVGGADKLRDEPLQIDSGPVSAFYHSNKNGGGVCGGWGSQLGRHPFLRTLSTNSIQICSHLQGLSATGSAAAVRSSQPRVVRTCPIVIPIAAR